MWLALHLHAKPVSSGPFWVIVQPVGFTQIIIVIYCFTREEEKGKKKKKAESVPTLAVVF